LVAALACAVTGGAETGTAVTCVATTTSVDVDTAVSPVRKSKYKTSGKRENEITSQVR
jgi:hypothetical protein